MYFLEIWNKDYSTQERRSILKHAWIKPFSTFQIAMNSQNKADQFDCIPNIAYLVPPNHFNRILAAAATRSFSKRERERAVLTRAEKWSYTHTNGIIESI